MSAFIVTSDTIDVIVAAGIKYNVITTHSADVIGEAILAQNVRAVARRYPDTLTEGSMPGAMPVEYVPHVLTPAEYSFTPFQRKLRRKAVEGAISCWQYQCAEFVGVEDTAISILVSIIQMRNQNRLLIADPDLVIADLPFLDVQNRDEVMLNVRQPTIHIVPEPTEGDEDEDVDGWEDGSEDDWDADEADVVTITDLQVAAHDAAEAEADEQDGV